MRRKWMGRDAHYAALRMRSLLAALLSLAILCACTVQSGKTVVDGKWRLVGYFLSKKFTIGAARVPDNAIEPPLLGSGISAGVGDVRLEWVQPVCRDIPHQRTNQTSHICRDEAVLSDSVHFDILDQDRDGIAREVELELLERFRPYYRFSLDDGADAYKPTDPAWYAKHSELFEGEDDKVLSVAELQDTSHLWTYSGRWQSPDLRQNPVAEATDYRLNIVNDAHEGGHDWPVIKAKAIGLMGHVSPLPEGEKDPAKITAYKVEYWQFYAYNDAPVSAAQHEGDWEAVMLVVNKDGQDWERVTHNIHSKIATFVKAEDHDGPEDDGPFRIYKGPNHGHVEWLILGQNTIGNPDNNVVSFFCDGTECTHPVVYIEHSGHASWPTAAWNWHGARKHFGDDAAHTYLVATPVNVGERGFPTPGCESCDLMLHFNGHWGGGNDGPPTPAFNPWAWGKP